MAASRVLRTGGLYFDGKDDRVVIPNSDSLNPTSAATWMFWVNLKRGGGSYKAVIAKHGYNPSLGLYTGWDFYVDPWNLMNFYFRYPQAVAIVDRSPLFGVWVHYALVNNGSHSWLYRNGVLIGEQDMVLPSPTPHSLTIGSRGSHLYGDHVVDEVRIYNRALSSYEISEIYTKGAFIKDGLVLCLPFYEGEGDIAHDVSGYGNHGTIYGASWVVKKALRVLPKAG